MELRDCESLVVNTCFVLAMVWTSTIPNVTVNACWEFRMFNQYKSRYKEVHKNIVYGEMWKSVVFHVPK